MPLRAEFDRERLDDVENRVDLALVATERDGLGERVGDDEKALRRETLDLNRAAGRDRLVAVGGDFEDRGFVFEPVAQPADARLQLVEHVLLFERRQADHHRDAEAEQGDHAVGAGVESERQRGDHVGPLEPGRVDAVADEQRAGGQARRRIEGSRVVHAL